MVVVPDTQVVEEQVPDEAAEAEADAGELPEAEADAGELPETKAGTGELPETKADAGETQVHGDKLLEADAGEAEADAGEAEADAGEAEAEADAGDAGDEADPTWRAIPGFHGYEASDRGLIRNTKTGKERKPYVTPCGYHRMVLMVDRKPKCVYVHRLIVVAHRPDEYDPELTVDHVDRNPSNNRIENLRMATMKEQHSNKRPRMRNVRGAPVYCEDEAGVVTLFPSTHEAARETGVAQSGIQRCAAGEYGAAGSMKWSYVHEIEPVEDLPDEEWRVVKAKTCVSTKGRVKTLVGAGWIVKSAQELCVSNGYPKVQIDGKDHRVHRLVASTFLDPPTDPASCSVNHKDGDKTNAAADNLEWVTTRQNALHARSSGLFKNVGGAANEPANEPAGGPGLIARSDGGVEEVDWL